jgi:hypothetical protein
MQKTTEILEKYSEEHLEHVKEEFIDQEFTEDEQNSGSCSILSYICFHYFFSHGNILFFWLIIL